MFNSKKNNLILLSIFLLSAVSATSYYKIICVSGSCSYDFVMNVVSPIEKAGFVLTLFALFLLFLPTKYFTTWFKYIFSWAFPLSVLIVVTSHNETMGFSIPKSAIVQLLGMVFGVVTIIFVAVQYISNKK